MTKVLLHGVLTGLILLVLPAAGNYGPEKTTNEDTSTTLQITACPYDQTSLGKSYSLSCPVKCIKIWHRAESVEVDSSSVTLYISIRAKTRLIKVTDRLIQRVSIAELRCLFSLHLLSICSP